MLVPGLRAPLGVATPKALPLYFPLLMRDGAKTNPLLLQTRVEPRIRRIPAAEEVGAPWCGWHTLRHTCASILFDDGRNVVQVQRWLGHHKPSFTIDTYVHLLEDDLGEPLGRPSTSSPIELAPPVIEVAA